jgi:2-C-methyl-D-erythritol 4-phosphate cytidylyltransferase
MELMERQRKVIIVAGGKGERMKTTVPKQFLKLNEKPLLMHTVNGFYQYDRQMEILLVLPENQINYWNELCEKYGFSIHHQVIAGGETRFHSVKNALDVIREECLIAVHDGVRPLVDAATIDRCFSKAEKTGTAVPVIDLVDTIREITENRNATLERKSYKLVQTPQVFKSEILISSYEKAGDKQFTDDASVVEAAGYPIHLVEGNRMNIKITNPLDLKIAELLMKEK